MTVYRLPDHLSKSREADRIAGSGIAPLSSTVFGIYPLTSFLLFKWSQTQVQFLLNAYEISCVYEPHYYSKVPKRKMWPLLIYSHSFATSFRGFSPTCSTERERERHPGKRWSRVSQNLGDYKEKKRFGGEAGKCEICLHRAWTGQCSHETVYLTWSWTPKIMHKILWQRKRFPTTSCRISGC